MKYKIKNITSDEMSCLLVQCPAIYEGIRELTLDEMSCMWVSCPGIYETLKEGKENVYLIVGKVVNPKDAGLEKKVGKDECLIEVPKDLIDKRKK